MAKSQFFILRKNLLYALLLTCILINAHILTAAEENENPLKVGDNYFKEAETFFSMKDYRSAIPFYEKSSESYLKAGKNYLAAYNYRKIGKSYYLVKEYNKAILNYNKAIKINKETENESEEQICHFELGDSYFEIKKIIEARDEYLKSLELNRKLAEYKKSLSDMIMIARCLTLLDDSKKAKQYLDEALELSRTYGDWVSTCDIITELAKTYLKEGEFKKSLDILDNGLKINIKVANKPGVARVTTTMAEIYLLLGNPTKSLDLLFNARRIYKDEKDPENGAKIISKIASIYEENRDFDNAIKYYNDAISEFDKLADNESLTQAKIRRAGVQILGGEIDEANETLREISTHGIESLSTINRMFYFKILGHLKLKTFDIDDAKSSFIRSVDSAREILDKTLIAEILLPLARSNNLEKSYEKSIGILSEAIKNVEKTDRLAVKADILLEMGITLAKLKNYNDALEHIKKAISISEKLSSKFLSLNGYINQGYVLAELGNFKDANDAFSRAARIWEELGFHQGRWEIFYGLSKILKNQGKKFEAIAYLENAIDLFLKVNFEESFSMIDEREAIYLDLIEILIDAYEREKDQKYLKKAFYYAELKKTEDFRELLRKGHLDLLAGVNIEEVGKLRKLTKERDKNCIRLFSRLLTEGKRNEIKSTLIKNEEDLGLLRKRIAEESPLFQMVYFPLPVEISLVQKILRGKSALLEYVIGDDLGFLFSFSAKGFNAFKIKGYNTIGGHTKTFIKTLNSPLTKINIKEHWESGKELHTLLLSQAYPSIENLKNLIIIPDKRIFNLPFEALIKGGDKISFLTSIEYLVKNHSFYYLPFATIIKSLSRKEKRKDNSILIMAEPIYNRITEEGITLKMNLENAGFDLTSGIDTSSEIEGIKSLYKGDSLFINRGENSRLEIFTRLNHADYKTIHFALKTFVPDSVNERLMPAIFFSNQESNERDAEADLGRTPGRTQMIFAKNEYIGDSESNGLLTAPELLKLNINSTLLFFSQSSVKPWGSFNNDGMVLFALSLSQKTSYLIHTLWEPFKIFNSRFIEFFYEEYFTKQKAGVALNTSKIKLIKSKIEISPGSGFNEELAFTTLNDAGKGKMYVHGAHPYFWANYRIYGLPE